MRYLVCLLLCCLAWPLSAQDEAPFDLFDSERGKEKTPPAPPPAPAAKPVVPEPPKPQLPPPPQKDFTLAGTSHIGQRHSVMLLSPEGKTVTQTLRSSTSVPIKGYEEFKLISVSPRQAQLAYPDNAPCRTSNEQKGIRCSADGKTATLSLLNAHPLPPSVPPVNFQAPVPTGQPAIDNPFAAAIQQANAQAGMAANPFAAPPQAVAPGMAGMQGNAPPPQNVKPQRIRPQDVPPGMKVISTPFGDRLVPER